VKSVDAIADRARVLRVDQSRREINKLMARSSSSEEGDEMEIEKGKVKMRPRRMRKREGDDMADSNIVWGALTAQG